VATGHRLVLVSFLCHRLTGIRDCRGNDWAFLRTIQLPSRILVSYFWCSVRLLTSALYARACSVECLGSNSHYSRRSDLASQD